MEKIQQIKILAWANAAEYALDKLRETIEDSGEGEPVDKDDTNSD